MTLSLSLSALVLSCLHCLHCQGSSDAGDELLIPPDNFSQVNYGVYRSGFPTKKNFPFLRTLHLRSLIYLCPEEYPASHLSFLQQHSVSLHHIPLQGNKEPFIDIPPELMTAALSLLLSPSHLPLLIHCNKGKHRTGCLVGVYRKVSGWSVTAVLDEYRRFSRPKERAMDMQFMELFDVRDAMELGRRRDKEERERRRRLTAAQTSGSGEVIAQHVRSVP